MSFRYLALTRRRDGSIAVMADGRLQDVDPLTGELEGESWRVLGRPMWVSIAPDGDRIAVTHWSDGKASDLLDGTASTQEGTWLAIVTADDHRVLYDDPATIDAHVLLDGRRPHRAGGQSHASLRDRAARSDRHRPRCGRRPREPIAEP